jgi:Peptidase family S41/N-terminal domain of Peptidase_S41 in eukaryotic IRBP
MSERLYPCLLRLVAPHFYRVYGEEATRLVRDRCRDEQGVIRKIGLGVDLLVDLVMAALRDHRFARQVLLSEKPVLSFAVGRSGSPHAANLLIGGALSLGILAALSASIGLGGRGHATSAFLPGIIQFSEPTRATSNGSSLNEQNGLARAHLSATLGFGSRLPRGSIALADSAIDAAEKKRVLNGAIANLREYYVYPNVAREMINALLTHDRNGDYAKEIDGAGFATLLTKQLQDVSHDLHLRVAYSAAEVPEHPPGPEGDARFRSMLKRENCGFRKVEVLSHNIGYVKFDGFGPLGLCRATGAAAMQFLALVDALIFDLRENHGGDPHMVSFMASYLFDRRTHLNDIYTPRGKATEEFWTVEDIPGPRFGKTPVFVLTSAATFSGGEEFTYDLKNLKRAVIVGETTGGGAHPVMMHRIDAHFTIGVPFARPINPISKTDWEGTGVAPDVRVRSAEALEVAQQLAVRALEHK